jgi:HlyD family secretion protein
MKRPVRRLLLILFTLAGLAAIVYAFLPKPVEVDVAEIARGKLQVTVNEDGKTRIKERYVVSMPLAGQIQRITLDPGDQVTAGQTLLATILPNNPNLLDPRARAESEARLSAAVAAVSRAEAGLDAALAAKEIADSQHERLRRLAERDAASSSQFESAQLTMRLRQEEHRSAQFALEIAKFERELAEAALKRFDLPENGTNHNGENGPKSEWQFDIVAPVNGRVLRVLQESAAVLNAGAPLMELGDPTNLELEIDVLSTDAVKCSPGDTVVVEHWGGELPLEAKVRLIEPAAFTKISALGVEEQRVFVIADLGNPPDERPNLGDAFRIEARIIVWEGEDVLQVPTSALFRKGGDWAVFVAQDARAKLTTVELGHRNADAAEVVSGLAEGDRVIVYPSDRVQDGVAVAPR